MTVRILGVDPGFRATGWVVLEVDRRAAGGRRTPRLLDAGVIRTKASAKKRHVYVADDDARCVQALFRGLWSPIERHQPAVMAVETPAGSKSSRAAKLMGMAYGVAVCAAESAQMQMIPVTAAEAREAAGGARSKAEVEAAMRGRFEWNGLLRDTVAGAREHAFDAAAVGWVVLEMRLARPAKTVYPAIGPG